MDMEIRLATLQEKAILRNMFELYIHDLSEFIDIDLDEHGCYGYKFLDHYWTEGNRYPYLVRVNGRLAGFAMVRRTAEEPVQYLMAEFFIVRKYRMLGIGKEVAEALFARHPGHWQVSQEIRNTAAQHFWYTVISAHTKGQFTRYEDHNRVHLQFTISIN